PCAFFLALWLWSWPKPRQLVLTTEGICLQDQRQSGSLAWDDVKDLMWGPGVQMDQAYIITGHPDAPSWWCERRTLFFRPKLVLLEVSTMCIDLDPLLLGWALVTYQQHPSLRSELGTDAARARLLDAGYAAATTPTEIRSCHPFFLYRPRWMT
ncbi:MAG: hypothetical protein FWE61_05270, partial [Micrococcales bacterium]|nr:hypothetical protein [Micrococcales bacterium]